MFKQIMGKGHPKVPKTLKTADLWMGRFLSKAPEFTEQVKDLIDRNSDKSTSEAFAEIEEGLRKLDVRTLGILKTNDLNQVANALASFTLIDNLEEEKPAKEVTPTAVKESELAFDEEKPSGKTKPKAK